MTREYIETQCRRISDNYRSSGVCRFAHGGGTLCFIDTSQEQNGTRGIAFLRDEMTVFFGSGKPRDIAYSDIKSLQIISSFEDFFADELAITGEDFDVRISDYSLDKSELKRFIEELCVESRIASEHRAQAEEYAKIIARRLSENALHEEYSPETRFAELPASKPEVKPGIKSEVKSETAVGELTENTEETNPAEKDIWGGKDEFGEINGFDEFIPENGVPVITETAIEIPSEKTVTVPDDYQPAPIPDERINWISGSFYEKKSEIKDDAAVIAVAESVPKTVTEENPVTEVHAVEAVPEKIPEPEVYAVEAVPEKIPVTEVHAVEAVPEKISAPEVHAMETIPEKTAEPEILVKAREKNEAPFETVILYSRENVEEADSKPEWLEVVEEIQNREERDNVPESTENVVPDGDALTQIQNMSREETLSFLAESLSEINGADPPEELADKSDDETEKSEPPFDIGADLKTISEISAPPEEDKDDGKLSVEPIWGDIYIKASRNLRELIESGRLSMEQIETELKDKLLDSARAFVDITADEAKVPKVLMPKITELKSAANDFDQYFKSGEDIAERAMFFMMYQMLSYADRIAETPETKERLNDFFRRFGSAGITLSMLDMRV